VLEASDRVGGSIATHRADGYVAELGPNSLFETPEIARLVDAVGLTGERLAADPAAKRRYVVRGRRLVALPSSPASALTTPVLSLGAKLRILAEPFVGAPRGGRRERRLVRAAAARRRGARRTGGCLHRGHLRGRSRAALRPPRPARRGRARGAPRIAHRGRGAEARARRRAGTPGGRPPMVSFRGGLHALPTAVARALGDAVRLQTRVVGMRRVADGWSLALRTPRGDHALAADAVLFAGPAHAIGAMALPGRLAASLAPVAAVEHAPVATLALGFRRQTWPTRSTGSVRSHPRRSGCSSSGVLFGSSIFAGRAPDGHVLLTCFLGGCAVRGRPRCPRASCCRRCSPSSATCSA
jgi:oxygen-dependent protoporphyrinogen oxidase